MTKKQKFEKFLNSVVKSHGDIEEDRKEIEKNVKKMLEFFENNHADVSDKSDLVSLVNDIKGRYHALYGRHDGLIGKIRNKVCHEKGESSDSGSEDSSDKDGPNNGQEGKYMQHIILEDYQSVQEQLHGLKLRKTELEAQADLLRAKLEEREHIARVSAERETVIEELENELQTMKESLKNLSAENEFLKIEIEKSKEQEGCLHSSVKCLHEEKEVLMLEKKKCLVILLETEKSMFESKNELERMKEEIVKVSDANNFLREEQEKTAQEVLHLNRQLKLAREYQESVRSDKEELKLASESLISENARILSENKNLKVQQEVATEEIANKNQRLLMMEKENDTLKSDVHRLSTLIHEADKTVNDIKNQSGLLKEEVTELNVIINDLNYKLKVKDDEIHAVALESSEASKIVQQAEERIMMLSGEIERIKSENSLLWTWNENTKLILEANNQELSKLRQALEAIESERNSLIDEKTALSSKINVGQVIIDGLKAQIEQLVSKDSEFQLKISNLDLELQAVSHQLNDANSTLLAAEEERMTLISENSVLRSKLQEAEFNAERLQIQLQELNEKDSILLNKIVEAEKTTNCLKSERDGLIGNNTQLEIKVKGLIAEQETKFVQLNQLEILIQSAEEEKTKFISEISTLTSKLDHAEVQIKKQEREIGLLSKKNTVLQQNQHELHNKRIDHEKRLEDALIEMQHLKETLELAQREASHEFQLMFDAFKRDVNEMLLEKDDLVQQIKTLAAISSEIEASMKQMEYNLRGKVSNHEALLQKYEELLSDHKQLKTKLDTAEKELEEMGRKEEIIQKLDTICTNQIKEIGKLDERYKSLLEKLSFTEIGVTDAEIEIQRLEVQLRLSNQKLKVTETEYLEKEENYKRLIAGLQEELKLLDKQVLALLGNSSVLNKECWQVKLVLDSVMKPLDNELQELESTAKAIIEYISNQLAECRSELQKVKMTVGSDSHLRKMMENEKHELELRLQYNEEIFLKLKDETSINKEKMVEKEKRLQILEVRFAESEKKLREKEREVIEKDDEKREAIRQLCLLIEYHWENCNHLVKYLSALQRRQHS